jgi:hypothetical protein
MNQRIIYSTDDGGVAIVIPAIEAKQSVLVSDAVTEIVDDEEVIISPAIYRDQTDEEFLQWIAAKDVPAGKPFQIVDVSDIPEDRTFRNAWELS